MEQKDKKLDGSRSAAIKFIIQFFHNSVSIKQTGFSATNALIFSDKQLIN